MRVGGGYECYKVCEGYSGAHWMKIGWDRVGGRCEELERLMMLHWCWRWMGS